jgi:hypothetical protein
VDRRLHDGLRAVAVLNPLRSEQEAFQLLLWVLAIAAVVVVVVLVARAIF